MRKQVAMVGLAIIVLTAACAPDVVSRTGPSRSEGLPAETSPPAPSYVVDAKPIASGGPASAAQAQQRVTVPAATLSANLQIEKETRVPLPRLEPGIDGPGITRSSITIGIPYDTTAAARMQAAYGVGMDRGAHGPWARIVARTLNERGGIAGRRVKVEVLKMNRRDKGQDISTYERRECRFFTQNKDVFAVFPEVPHHQEARSCYLEAGVLSIASTGLDADQEIFSTYPNVYSTSSPNFNRWSVTYIEALRRQGFFDRAKGVGLISYDDPVFERAISETFLPEMERRGLPIDRVALLEHPKQDPGKLAAQSSAAVAEFQEAGIDRVMFLEGGSPMASGIFLFAADKANADFSYGFSTWNAPGATFDGGITFPDSQLQRTQGLGWAPPIDLRVPLAKQQLPPRARKWLRIFAKHGHSFDRCCGISVALQLVERFLFLKSAIERIEHGAINLETFRHGVSRLGGSFRPLMTMRSSFGPDRFDGPTAYRDLRWSDACRCLRYRGPLRTFLPSTGNRHGI